MQFSGQHYIYVSVLYDLGRSIVDTICSSYDHIVDMIYLDHIVDMITKPR